MKDKRLDGFDPSDARRSPMPPRRDMTARPDKIEQDRGAGIVVEEHPEASDSFIDSRGKHEGHDRIILEKERLPVEGPTRKAGTGVILPPTRDQSISAEMRRSSAQREAAGLVKAPEELDDRLGCMRFSGDEKRATCYCLREDCGAWDTGHCTMIQRSVIRSVRDRIKVSTG